MHHSNGETTQLDEESNLVEAVEYFLNAAYWRSVAKHRQTSKQSLYVIGEDIGYIERISGALAREGQFNICGHAKPALERIVTSLNRKDIDVILIDVGNSMTHHLKAVQMLRHMYPSTAIIAIMPDDTPLHLKQASWCGVSGYVLKSASTEEIVSKIGTVHESQQLIDSALT